MKFRNILPLGTFLRACGHCCIAVTTSTWSTVNPGIASGASNFVDSTSDEMLVCFNFSTKALLFYSSNVCFVWLDRLHPSIVVAAFAVEGLQYVQCNRQPRFTTYTW